MRKILITGGAGFIGSHLADALLRSGDHVVVIDDMSTGRIDNIQHLQSSERFDLTIGSILDASILEPLIEQCDIVFHLAASVGVHRVLRLPVQTIEVNVLGTRNVLSFAARYAKLCVIASTSEVYGKGTKQPLTENDDTLYGPTTKARWSYACSKAIDEFLALAYHRESALPAIICRLFNTTGPRQSGEYGMVLPSFVDQSLRGAPITVFGDGTQSRCFADVSDVVEALQLLTQHPAAIGQVFNIGNPEEISIYDLAKLVKKRSLSNSEIRLVPYRQAYGIGFDDMSRRLPSIEKISRLTGFRPKVSLHEIVDRMIAKSREESCGATSHTELPHLST
jgi:UDP-glucose 4-epimerase